MRGVFVSGLALFLVISVGSGAPQVFAKRDDGRENHGDAAGTQKGASSDHQLRINQGESEAETELGTEKKGEEEERRRGKDRERLEQEQKQERERPLWKEDDFFRLSIDRNLLQKVPERVKKAVADTEEERTKTKSEKERGTEIEIEIIVPTAKSSVSVPSPTLSVPSVPAVPEKPTNLRQFLTTPVFPAISATDGGKVPKIIILESPEKKLATLCSGLETGLNTVFPTAFTRLITGILCGGL